MYGACRHFIIFTPINTSDVSPSLAAKGVEVVEHLLAAVVGFDPAAIQHDRPVTSGTGA